MGSRYGSSVLRVRFVSARLMSAVGGENDAATSVLIVPLVFIIWGVSRIGLSHQDNMWPLVAWVTAALALMPVGLLTPRPFELDHASGQITRPGSWFPLIRNVTVFALQYTVAVIAAVNPGGGTVAAIVGRAISGATAGYFIGSTVALRRQYWKKRAMDIGT